MDSKQREEWLRNLKADEVVGAESWSNQEKTWEKVQVERITPTGRIKVKTAKGNIVDYGRGGFVHGSGWGSGSSTLVPWSEEFTAIMARRRLVNQVMYYLDRSVVDPEKVKTLSDEQLTMLRDFMRPLRRDTKDN